MPNCVIHTSKFFSHTNFPLCHTHTPLKKCIRRKPGTQMVTRSDEEVTCDFWLGLNSSN